MTDIVYMHRANHRIQLSSLKDIYGVRYMLDVSKQQLRVHLENLVVSWAQFEVKVYRKECGKGNVPACLREPHELEATPFFQGVKNYYQSYSDFLVALERAYRDFEQTPDAWNLVKKIIEQLLADRSACARVGGTSAVSLAQRAGELMRMFEITYNFTRQRIDKNGCLATSEPPMWLRAYVRAADVASKRIALKIPQSSPTQLTTPAQSTPAPAAGSQLSFGKCCNIIRSAIQNGMAGFPHALHQFQGTHKYAETGCAQCISLLMMK